MKDKTVCCQKCSFFEYQFVALLNTDYIEGERFKVHSYNEDIGEEEIKKIREEHRIPNHELVPPSGCCGGKIQMCQHKDCFTAHYDFMMGVPTEQQVRTQGQAQLNPYGECERYKRKIWRIK